MIFYLIVGVLNGGLAIADAFKDSLLSDVSHTTAVVSMWGSLIMAQLTKPNTNSKGCC